MEITFSFKRTVDQYTNLSRTEFESALEELVTFIRHQDYLPNDDEVHVIRVGNVDVRTDFYDNIALRATTWMNLSDFGLLVYSVMYNKMFHSFTVTTKKRA